MKTFLAIILAASVASADWCHVGDKAWTPRPLPQNFGAWGAGYNTVVPDVTHYADGWRVAVPAEPRSGFKISSSHPEFTATEARQVVDVWIDIAAQAKADEDARKSNEAAEDARVAALPSVVAIIAENATLKTKLAAAEAALAAVKATADKAATDIAALKTEPKPVEPAPK